MALPKVPFAPSADISAVFIRVWLAVLLAISAYIRVHGGDAYHYNTDEALNIDIAQGKSLGEVLRFSRYETHPPLFEIMCHYWMMLSSDPGFVRGLPLMFGLGTIPLYYVLGRNIGGAVAGMCCAALAAFSFGGIVQSYLMRQYAPFIFFASFGFYFYLRWRRENTASLLLAYGVCEALACLTHFSGLFTVPCFLIFEALERMGARDHRRGCRWYAVNGTVLVLALLVYHAWEPTMASVKPYFFQGDGMRWQLALALALSYPLAVFTYALPCNFAAFAVAALLLAFAFGTARNKPEYQGRRVSLALAGIMLGLGMALTLTGLYPFPGTRRSLWTLPFILPPLGWIMADILGMLRLFLPGTWRHAAALILLAGGWMTYSPALQFSDNVEYSIEMRQWDAVTPFLASLGPQDLIVAQKEDASLLESLYPYLGDAPFTGMPKAAIAPYGHTHILFSPAYRILRDRGMLIAMLKEAGQRHFFDHIERLVFMRTVITSAPVFALMRCSALKDKEFVPPLSHFREAGNGFLFMRVSASPFLQEVLEPSSGMQGCLEAD